MSVRRRVALALALAGLLAATLGTGGFGATIADRGIDLAVADDDRAYLRLDATAGNVSAGVAGTVTVAVTNAVPSEPTLDVTVAADGERRRPGRRRGAAPRGRPLRRDVADRGGRRRRPDRADSARPLRGRDRD